MKTIATKIAHNDIAGRHFSAATRRALTKKGIRIVTARHMPGVGGSYIASDAGTGYELDDNGTSRIRNFLEVLALAV